MTTGCIVHDRKTLSKFHHAVNQLRQTSEFAVSTVQQLPKRCCSCHGQPGERRVVTPILIASSICAGESSFEMEHLRRICSRMELTREIEPVKVDPVELDQFVLLRSAPSARSRNHQSRLGRFIGPAGKYVTKMEQELNVSIQIVNSRSSRHLQESTQNLRNRLIKYSSDATLVVFSIADGRDDFDTIQTIQRSIEQRWINVDTSVQQRPARSAREHSTYVIAPFVPIDADFRWRPKKRIPKTKLKRAEKQQLELEKALSDPATNQR